MKKRFAKQLFISGLILITGCSHNKRITINANLKEFESSFSKISKDLNFYGRTKLNKTSNVIYIEIQDTCKYLPLKPQWIGNELISLKLKCKNKIRSETNVLSGYITAKYDSNSTKVKSELSTIGIHPKIYNQFIFEAIKNEILIQNNELAPFKNKRKSKLVFSFTNIASPTFANIYAYHKNLFRPGSLKNIPIYSNLLLELLSYSLITYSLADIDKNKHYFFAGLTLAFVFRALNFNKLASISIYNRHCKLAYDLSKIKIEF